MVTDLSFFLKCSVRDFERVSARAPAIIPVANKNVRIAKGGRSFESESTLLLDGRVLIAGGTTSGSSSPLATTELYDPITGSFTAAATMTAPRAGHTATLLPDGKVLVTGGFTDSTLVGTDTAEIYDPAEASFLATNMPMAAGRWAHTATLLPDSTVLLFGGESLDSFVAETYNPADGSFSAVGVDDSDRTGHTATLMKDGRVLIIGGVDSAAGELYQ